MTPADVVAHDRAAAAAGWRLEWKEGVCKGGPFCAPFLAGTDQPWRPREDDGDCLRLAMAVGLQVMPAAAYHLASDRVWRAVDSTGVLAATRFAVFRAAADLGVLPA